MARSPTPTDFSVDVDGIGTFRFARRRMKDEVAVQVMYAKLISGAIETSWLTVVCGWLSALAVLTVSAPDDWDVDAMDPEDSDTYDKLGRVYDALRAQERLFRQGKKPVSQNAGDGPAPNGGVLVPA